MTNENSKFRYTVSLNMAQTPVAQVPLHDYQEKAVAELKKHFIDNDMTSGLLVMPTGSGKSRTASYFLIREMISRGYQILWIAHRHNLIDRAADCFYDFAGLSKIENPKIRDFRINCISDIHMSLEQLKDVKSEVVVAGISSICKNKSRLKRILGKKVMIVVGEAYNTFDPTYQDVIKFIGKCRKETKLLGLTSFPVSENERDGKKLLGIYGNSIVFSVSMTELVEKGFLSQPKGIGDEFAEESRKPDYEAWEWKRCKEVHDSNVIKAAAYGKTVSLPAAWYTLIDEEGELYRMLVYEDQLKGILAMKKDKVFWMNNPNFTAEDAAKKYFSYFCIRPSIRDLEIYMDNVRNCEDMPVARVMENRKSVEPYYVAKAAEEQGVDLFEAATRAYEQFNVAADLYGSLEQYQLAVCKAKIYKEKSAIEGFKVEELPVQLIPFDTTPYHNLDELVREVKEERFGGEFDGLGSIEWTDKPYRQYYGMFYHADNSILINCVLNSKDVPKEVVKFVIYHEMLHRDNHSHDKAFREEEQKYPAYENCEAFLHSNMYLFDIKEW